MPGGQADAAQVPCGGLLTEMVAAVTAPSACDIPLVSDFFGCRDFREYGVAFILSFAHGLCTRGVVERYEVES